MVAGLVAFNYGIAILPRVTILNQFDVKVIKISNPNPTRYIYLASVRNKSISPTLMAFKNFIIAQTKHELLK